ncbi:MAG TPA: cytochrome c oxidase subunit 3 [Bryobacteraceae bacterium]|nr:cytochrome c oxidase subunit 3 [Bryobacteraceae bacterium]
MSARTNPPGAKRLGMWLFVVSDLLTFATLLVVYTALRLATPDWPHPFTLSPAILYATGMTIVLLGSSLTMVWAVSAMEAHNRPRTVRWLLATIAGGTAFIVLHLAEWRHLLQVDHITPAASLFGAVFYAVTGLHMLHVAAGIVYLAVLTGGVARGRFTAEDVETGGLYWHFVDLVWMFVFPLIYLMAVRP